MLSLYIKFANFQNEFIIKNEHGEDLSVRIKFLHRVNVYISTFFIAPVYFTVFELSFKFELLRALCDVFIAYQEYP